MVVMANSLPEQCRRASQYVVAAQPKKGTGYATGQDRVDDGLCSTFLRLRMIHGGYVQSHVIDLHSVKRKFTRDQTAVTV